MPDISTGQDFDVTPQPQAPVALQNTHLKLDAEKKEELERRCVTRIGELQKESGVMEDGSVETDSWMGRRKKYQDIFDSDFDWRKLQYGGVFDVSNLTLGTAQRYVRETHAKAADDLLGTRPFFAAVKTDTGDDATARAVEELIQQKVDRSDIQLELRSCIRSAIVRNECVVKIRYVRRSTPYLGSATVMVDQSGQPVYTPNGLLIYENDDFLPDPAVEEMFRLKKDPLFSMRQGEFDYQNFDSLQQELIQYEGVEVRELDYRSFLCPLRCPSIHEADMVVQLYDDTPQHAKEIYGQFEGFDEYFTNYGTNETSGERQAKTTQGEQDYHQPSSIDIYRPFAECYVRADVDGDGIEEEIFVVMDMTNKKMVFCEYLANIMPKRPFEVIPGIDRVPNRWYGEGVIQAVLDQCTYIDAQFNRFNVKDGKESSIDFRDPNAVKEWRMGAQVEFGSNKVYDVEPGYDKDNRPPLWRVNLQEKSEIGMELMKEAQQQTNLMFGIIGAKDASSSDLNQSRTATGILNIERTANLLIKNTEIQQQHALIRIMEQVTTLVLENLRDTELLLTKDGKQLLTINRDEARTISREIRLLLTRSRSSELLTINQQALAFFKDFHAIKGTPAIMVAKLGRPLYLNMLKALEIADPDELCPNVTDEEIAQWQEQQAAGQQAELKRTTREMISYKDCPPSIQAQWEQDSGWTPATPEERMAYFMLQNPPKEPPAEAKKDKPAYPNPTPSYPNP